MLCYIQTHTVILKKEMWLHLIDNLGFLIYSAVIFRLPVRTNKLLNEEWFCGGREKCGSNAKGNECKYELQM